MRFVPNGPNIPRVLLQRHRQGNVLFLCGAGASMPAPSSLPNFSQLACKVYAQLDDPVHAILSDPGWSDPASRQGILKAHAASPAMCVEVDLFCSGQLDRLFTALEKRLDLDPSGGVSSDRVRSAVESILRESKEFHQGHRDLLRLSTAASTRRDRIGEPTCRIATTNFDHMLESAWTAEFGTEATSFDARLAPRPGSHAFEGIVHLHGMLGRDFILTSRDFARSYLRSGSVANYVYDLIRRYTLVLVGYALDDPPMRYLMDAVAEDVDLFDDMNQPYVISDQPDDPNDPDGLILAASWKAKNIEPILFKHAPDDRFGPLWQTLHEWAEWTRNEDVWIEATLTQHTSSSYATATDFSRSIVTELISTLGADDEARAVRFLTEKGVAFDWIDAISTALNSSTDEPS